MDPIEARKRLTEQLAALPDSAKILDVGGWGRPLRQATHVIDQMPYETRERELSVMGGEERFSEATWSRRDLCAREPWPYPDKFFDFVFCSHTLEDLRDPLGVCSEIIRVGRQGYVEVPHRVKESTLVYSNWWRRLLGRSGYVGFAHHRWLVHIEGNSILFSFKSAMIHERGRFHFRPRWYETVKPEYEVDGLFWRDRFSFSESWMGSNADIAEQLAAYRGRFRGREVFAPAPWQTLTYFAGYPSRLWRRRRSPGMGVAG